MAQVSVVMDVKTAQAVNNLQNLLRAEQAVAGGAADMGKQMGDAGKKGKGASDEMGSGLSMILGRWVSIGGAIGLAATAFHAFQKDIEDAVKAASEFEDAFAQLASFQLALSTPQRRKLVEEFAVSAEVPLPKAARSIADLFSQTAPLSDIKRTELAKEIAEFSRAQRVDPQTITEAFSAVALKFPQLDANQIQNVLAQMFQQANVQVERLAPYIARAMGPAQAMGLDVAQATAIISAGTRELGNVEQTVTGFRNTLLILKELESDTSKIGAKRRGGKELTDRDKILMKAGLTEGGDVVETMADLGKKLSPAELGELFGRENFLFASAMAQRPDVFRQEILAARETIRPGLDITATGIEKRFAEDEMARVESLRRQAGVRIETAKGQDIRSLQFATEREIMEAQMREAGAGALKVGAARAAQAGMQFAAATGGELAESPLAGTPRGAIIVLLSMLVDEIRRLTTVTVDNAKDAQEDKRSNVRKIK